MLSVSSAAKTSPGLMPTGEATDLVGKMVESEPATMRPLVPGTARSRSGLMPVLKFNDQKFTNEGVVGGVVFESRVSNCQVPLMAPLAITFARKVFNLRPSGSETKLSFSTRKSPTAGPATALAPAALESTMLRAALSMNVVPTS